MLNKVVVSGVDGSFGSVVASKIMELLPKESLLFTSPNEAGLMKYEQMGIKTAVVNLLKEKPDLNILKDADKALLISMPFIGEKRQKAHKDFVDACVNANVKQIVYISLMDAVNPMNVSVEKIDHGYTEAYIQRQEIDYIILRNSQYAEAMISVYFKAIEDGTYKLRNNMDEGRVALISRSDCAVAAAYALANTWLHKAILNINGYEAVTMTEFVAMGNAATLNNVKYEAITDEKMYAYFDSLGVPRTTDGYFDPKSPFQFASDGMVTFGQAIREGDFNIKTSDFIMLTGREPISLSFMFKNASKYQIGSRRSSDEL